jgi:magnesium chelatase family protein
VNSQVLFAAPSKSTDTNDIRARIEAARRTQLTRAGKLNSALTAPEVDAYCELDPASRRLVERAMDRLGLSARGVHRVLKVGRTLADLVGAHHIAPAHVTEALAFRDVAVDY